MKEKFRDLRLSKANQAMLDQVNEIILEYLDDGYTLSLRQLYYQLVSRDVIPNSDAEYKKLGSLLKEGRMAGIVDWDAIEDRLRKISQPAAWDSAKEILQSAHNQFRMKRMAGQPKYLEIWVEKDALSEVVERAADPYGIPVLVNRGSASAMYDTYQRITKALSYFYKDEYDIDGEPHHDEAIIFYLGDHDPSGLDMVRDVTDRVTEMLASKDIEGLFSVQHLAITREQIDQYNPPPNPAKITDTRAAWYIENHGEYSWEVDALPPKVLIQVIDDAINREIDKVMYQDVMEREQKQKNQIRKFIKTF